MVVKSIALRNNILANVRYDGLTVYVNDDSSNYQLRGCILNTCWVKIGVSDGVWRQSGSGVYLPLTTTNVGIGKFPVNVKLDVAGRTRIGNIPITEVYDNVEEASFNSILLVGDSGIIKKSDPETIMDWYGYVKSNYVSDNTFWKIVQHDNDFLCAAHCFVILPIICFQVGFLKTPRCF